MTQLNAVLRNGQCDIRCVAFVLVTTVYGVMQETRGHNLKRVHHRYYYDLRKYYLYTNDKYFEQFARICHLSAGLAI